jgi:hypothetical protein
LGKGRGKFLDRINKIYRIGKRQGEVLDGINMIKRIGEELAKNL